MIIWSNSLKSINKLMDSNKFINFELSTWEQFNRRIKETDKTLRSSFYKIFNTHNAAIIASGSYGRGDLCLHSDLDIILLQERKFYPSSDWTQLIYTITERKTSIQFIFLDECLHPQLWPIHLWYHLLSARYICGNIFFWKYLKNCFSSSIQSMTTTEVLNLKSLDMSRSIKDGIPSEPHYYSIKTGNGCIIDCQFASILKIWLSSRRSLTAREEELFTINSNSLRYLVLLKEYMHHKGRGPLESFDFLYNNFLGRVLFFYSPLFHPYRIEQIRSKNIQAIHTIIQSLLYEDPLCLTRF